MKSQPVNTTTDQSKTLGNLETQAHLAPIIFVRNKLRNPDQENFEEDEWCETPLYGRVEIMNFTELHEKAALLDNEMLLAELKLAALQNFRETSGTETWPSYYGGMEFLHHNEDVWTYSWEGMTETTAQWITQQIYILWESSALLGHHAMTVVNLANCKDVIQLIGRGEKCRIEFEHALITM